MERRRASSPYPAGNCLMNNLKRIAMKFCRPPSPRASPSKRPRAWAGTDTRARRAIASALTASALLPRAKMLCASLASTSRMFSVTHAMFCASDESSLFGYSQNRRCQMSQTLEATFDGEVLRPDEPIELEPNTRVRITIEPTSEAADESKSFLDTALSLKLEGPSDWSERLDDYLYGGKTPGE